MFTYYKCIYMCPLIKNFTSLPDALLTMYTLSSSKTGRGGSSFSEIFHTNKAPSTSPEANNFPKNLNFILKNQKNQTIRWKSNDVGSHVMSKNVGDKIYR